MAHRIFGSKIGPHTHRFTDPGSRSDKQYVVGHDGSDFHLLYQVMQRFLVLLLTYHALLQELLQHFLPTLEEDTALLGIAEGVLNGGLDACGHTLSFLYFARQ